MPFPFITPAIALLLRQPHQRLPIRPEYRPATPDLATPRAWPESTRPPLQDDTYSSRYPQGTPNSLYAG